MSKNDRPALTIFRTIDPEGPRRLAGMIDKKLKYRLYSVFDPDWCDEEEGVGRHPEFTGTDTLLNIREKAMFYISYFEVNGGEFAIEIEDGYRISYNGRMWTSDNKEIVVNMITFKLEIDEEDNLGDCAARLLFKG